MAKEFSNLIPNRANKSILLKNDAGFVTHQELGLVYNGIRGDLQEMDNKFSLEFVDVKINISKLDEKFTKEFSSVRDEIRHSREESHRELIEVKNEFEIRFDGLDRRIGNLESDVATLKSDVEELKTGMNIIIKYVMDISERLNKIEELVLRLA